MSDTNDAAASGRVEIYVLPSETGFPPRAVVQYVQESDEASLTLRNFVVWNADTGSWSCGGEPVDPVLGEAITAHARDLGVKW